MSANILSKELLQRLYIEKKMSSVDIGKIQGCSEHKVNYWIRKYNIPKRSIAEALYTKHNPAGDPFLLKHIKNLEDAKLLGIGLGLYWGEGNKKNVNSVKLGNTDPNMIRIFIKFLVELMGVKVAKLRFGLQIFSDLKKSTVLNFWLNSLKKFGIVREQFYKVTTTLARSIGTYREKSQYGVLTVYVHNIKLKKIFDNLIADVAQW
ncbi:MAG: hypothetical protein A3A33_04565 [Candidatus Yanofskybacteria bacterium RIFCSPLOWO2_01_FULL_49_25]|uniref:Homing endonuclease LAGLIDADG domain-containing protein n=1 Tax=Candidatus Yanofskybacteria bacterium RIFCSPLOWO2_01_FULL_49_25 TaxID=1802701 RepID=A0A1F8GR23_9BACT|nr:MAG: hypothetical protein A3A33_04565 [Candidatus Yanofskybacteria bacterium RIFCSPLOWO2_01_FULL_49_25]